MNETELHPEARALIDATKDAYAPSATSRAKAHWALERRLAGASRPRPSGALRYLRLALGSGALLALAGGAAAAVYLAVRGAPESPSAVPAASQLSAPSASPGANVATRVGLAEQAKQGEPREAAVAAQAGREENASDASVRPSSAATSSERADAKERGKRTLASLEGEIALLRQVNALREEGSPARALRLLDEYEKANGPGALGQERAAARTLCLCALGRSSKSQQAAARFALAYPKSPQLPRVRVACGLEP